MQYNTSYFIKTIKCSTINIKRTYETSIRTIKTNKRQCNRKADILETELDIIGASVDNTIYLNNLRKLARLIMMCQQNLKYNKEDL